MKTKNKLTLLSIIAAAWSLNITPAVGQPIDSVESLNNRAVAASSRAKEVFPWLTRGTITAVTPAKASDSKAALADVTWNRALAASPRVLEQHPELARAAVRRQASSAEPRVRTNELSALIKNRAVAASPRALEQFPELARGSSAMTAAKTFEIAPLK